MHCGRVVAFDDDRSVAVALEQLDELGSWMRASTVALAIL